MLPDRSKRYAGIDGEIQRLRLAGGLQIALTGFLLVLVLALVFPRRALIDELYAQNTVDDLSLSYIQNLYRSDTRNADAALLLARTQARSMAVQDIEELTLPILDAGSASQRELAAGLLLDAYQDALLSARDPRVRAHWTKQLEALLRSELEHPLAPALAQRMATAAFAAHLFDLGDQLATVSDKETSSPGIAPNERLGQLGDRALDQAQFTQAADYFFEARARAIARNDARRLFQRGVDALMRGNLYAEAMQAAERNLGDLKDDPATLRYMIGRARAAAAPDLAARYARRLVLGSKAELLPQNSAAAKGQP